MVRNHPHRAAEIWTLVERRVGEETFAPVRAMMLYTLAPLIGLDSARFGICLRRLTLPLSKEQDDASALAVLATHMGVHLFPYIERDLPDLALELMGRMIDSPDRNLNLIGTWWALAERLRQGNSTGRFPDIERKSPAHTKLWASILCNFVASTGFRDLAIAELEQFFSMESLRSGKPPQTCSGKYQAMIFRILWIWRRYSSDRPPSKKRLIGSSWPWKKHPKMSQNSSSKSEKDSSGIRKISSSVPCTRSRKL